jgi:hypothetical protein
MVFLNHWQNAGKDKQGRTYAIEDVLAAFDELAARVTEPVKKRAMVVARNRLEAFLRSTV